MPVQIFKEELLAARHASHPSLPSASPNPSPPLLTFLPPLAHVPPVYSILARRRTSETSRSFPPNPAQYLTYLYSLPIQPSKLMPPSNLSFPLSLRSCQSAVSEKDETSKKSAIAPSQTSPVSHLPLLLANPALQAYGSLQPLLSSVAPIPKRHLREG